MTTPYLAKDIGQDEGLRLHAYPDPDTHGAPWTIGYGCTGAGIGPETVWTQDQADDALAQRIQQVQTQLDHAIPWWRRLNDARQDVLVNLGYNLGVAGLCKWGRMLTAAKGGFFDTAAVEIAGVASDPSEYAKEVGARAWRLARQMRGGERIAPGAPL